MQTRCSRCGKKARLRNVMLTEANQYIMVCQECYDNIRRNNFRL